MVLQRKVLIHISLRIGRCSGLYLSVSMAAFVAAAMVCAEEAKMALQIHSPAFADDGEIPPKYTCEGDDVAPPLEWEGVPGSARSLVLIVDDPDAPDPAAPRMTWVHWLLYNLPADISGLPEGVTAADLPVGAGGVAIPVAAMYVLGALFVVVLAVAIVAFVFSRRPRKSASALESTSERTE